VTILRERHPFEGRVLLALGAVHRRGVALLLVVLPDGSRSLIPAGWTDLAAIRVAEPTAAIENDRHHSLARLVDFLHARTILDALLSRVPSPRPTLRPQRRAAVQLTLALLELPAPPAAPGVQLDKPAPKPLRSSRA
jgi:hypothetical protein